MLEILAISNTNIKMNLSTCNINGAYNTTPYAYSSEVCIMHLIYITACRYVHISTEEDVCNCA